MSDSPLPTRDEIDHAWQDVCRLCDAEPSKVQPHVRELVALLDASEPLTRYSALPAAFFEGLLSPAFLGTGPQRWRVLDLVLIETARGLEQRFERADLPRALLPYFAQNVARMLRRARDPAPWARSPRDDVFLKDLGILRTTLLPCASHLVFRRSGVPRSLVLRQSPPAMLRALHFFGLRCGGFAPFLENHVHPAMLEHFNPEGRDRCYQLVAQLLLRWPESRGLMGLSWYYDPAVAGISPRLAYLREVPERAGALLLPAGGGADVVGGAIATSPTRKRLYEEGRYQPARYLMAWSRHDILQYCGT